MCMGWIYHQMCLCSEMCRRLGLLLASPPVLQLVSWLHDKTHCCLAYGRRVEQMAMLDCPIWLPLMPSIWSCCRVGMFFHANSDLPWPLSFRSSPCLGPTAPPILFQYGWLFDWLWFLHTFSIFFGSYQCCCFTWITVQSDRNTKHPTSNWTRSPETPVRAPYHAMVSLASSSKSPLLLICMSSASCQWFNSNLAP